MFISILIMAEGAGGRVTSYGLDALALVDALGVGAGHGQVVVRPDVVGTPAGAGFHVGVVLSADGPLQHMGMVGHHSDSIHNPIHG